MSRSGVEDAGIPVIDISNPSSAVALQVLHAASTFGFLFIKNDGMTIPPKDIEDMFELSREFFKLPRELKAEYAIHSKRAGGNNRGWVSMQGESLDPEGQKQGDPKEAFNIAESNPSLQPLPSPLSSSSPLISRFQASCHTLCTNILALLGNALSIPSSHGGATWFATRHDQTLGPSGTILRLLYYPSTTAPKDSQSIRAGAHSDYGSLTLLFRPPGNAGLEILKGDGSWGPVPVNPYPSALSSPPILVNIGDLLSFWTSGTLKSTIHRVAFAGGEERYSIAYFCHPRDEVKLEAVPSKLIDEFGKSEEIVEEMERQKKTLGLEGSGNGVALTAKEHLDRRLRVTYGLKE
ncbi:Clavaminate synthase-like protein [Lindgomyces ingoldianus]|uniref:Clavaminate synthase-like protein n=1 Tax=Lindgomyces ingoldianus TaxID=673940 RepID=A0ACB6QPZ7_9PLEO|nr:Clavaminate synthase-like protein [Lindgomyces ingoldianus]KAF2468947.1 Clavaminate synthase-like protein [Lindgomyces ingoldianus]